MSWHRDTKIKAGREKVPINVDSPRDIYYSAREKQRGTATQRAGEKERDRVTERKRDLSMNIRAGREKEQINVDSPRDIYYSAKEKQRGIAT